MAKKSGKPADTKSQSEPQTQTANGSGSVQGYFRPIFLENPKLLKERSNEALYERWLQDHPGHKEVPVKIKQNLSNLKSVLRGKMALRKRRKQAQSAEGDATAKLSARLTHSVRGPRGLEHLESQIDEALSLAKQVDREGLDDVIRLLRTARNRVIIRIGGE